MDLLLLVMDCGFIERGGITSVGVGADRYWSAVGSLSMLLETHILSLNVLMVDVI